MLPIIKPLTAEERGLVGSTWAYRAESEVRAVQRFSSLGQALRVHGASPTVLQLCDRAVSDEERHVGICAKLAREFGVEPQIEDITRPGPLAPSDLSVDQQVFYEVVAVCCINETISAAILGEMLRLARPGRVHDTVQEILRDEINHGRIGWALLAHEAAQGPLEDVSANITWMLDAAITDELLSGQAVEDQTPSLQTWGPCLGRVDSDCFTTL